MPATFSRTLRSLDTDRSRWRGVSLLGVGLLAAWSSWLVLGQVTVYQMTERARLEVGSSVHPIATPVGGRVVETQLAIGQEVVAGEVLVVLYDDRAKSPTYGMVSEIFRSELMRDLMVIPAGVYHAHQNVGSKDALFVSMPTRAYDHADPDVYRLPVENDVIPYKFTNRLGR